MDGGTGVAHCPLHSGGIRNVYFYTVQKILLIRFSAIGDIVLTTPVIRCVKQQLKATLHFVSKQGHVDLLEANPYLDKVYGFKRDIHEVVEELRGQQYDHVIDLHHNIRSFRLKRRLKVTASTFPKLNVKKWLYVWLKWNTLPDVHVVDRYFEAVKPLGVHNDGAGLDHYIPRGEELSLSQWQLPSLFVACAIGGQFATKKLPTEKWVDIIGRLRLPVVLLGGKEDIESAQRIVAACPHVHNVVGKLRLHQSAAVVARSQKVLTHDTGLMHIAAAFKKQIVSIWGNTTPQLGMSPYLPSQHRHLSSVHQVALNCRPCSKIGYDSCPKGHFRCMNEQDTAAIAAAVNREVTAPKE